MLISRLKDKRYGSCYMATLDHFGSVDATNKETLKNIGCSLERGYRYLTSLNAVNLNDLCKYLNFWMDEQKSTYVKGNSGITEQEWHTVENLWNSLNNIQYFKHKCERQQEKKDISEYRKHINLMTYCINRDYFKKLYLSTSSYMNLKLKMCESFSDYTREYYNKLIEGIGCIDNRNDVNVFKYEIAEDCTLYNIPKTFPKCDEKTQTIVDDDNYKKDTIRCESTAKIRDSHPGLDNGNVVLSPVSDTSTGH
ncbi:hypothetical protein PVNG_06287 [Plasmodium vivax North Korean]|uniref:Uncharacterized protein n=1 Tax=Plasmodium vivax North Korean TaxID=1035514 RepID=A0A0J9W6B4_PLAVI|nr:hypothetical protein PVNG_06287 [Plasmodium vivax North Korean]